MVAPDFGWDYPTGALNDPHAPWNQPDLDALGAELGSEPGDPDDYEEPFDWDEYEQRLYDLAEEAALAKWEDRHGGGD